MESMLEKFVGDNLEIIGKESFFFSHYFKDINLKNVKEIGYCAFANTSLKIIKNNFIQVLNKEQFSYLIDEV